MPGNCELAELVSDHVLGDIHWDELPPIVNCECQSEKVRNDHRATAPCLDDGVATTPRSKHRRKSMKIDENRALVVAGGAGAAAAVVGEG